MKPVRAKKKLGQHFLTDLTIAQKIAETLLFDHYEKVLEIGPGMGVLTQFLVPKTKNLHLIEIDSESVNYLRNTYTEMEAKLIEGDFLKIDLKTLFGTDSFAIIGNFPYNISTQIVFKTLENRNQIPFFAGMFQKEVAERICSSTGTKKYGILSVLIQAFYNVDYLFTVNEDAFNPPPKVKSGVIRIERNDVIKLDCDEKLFFRVVKAIFNQRRKMARNSLKSMLGDLKIDHVLLTKRPEQLSVENFIEITKLLESEIK